MAVDPVALFDLDRHPVTELDGRGAAIADHHAAELAAMGVPILPGFLRADGLPAHRYADPLGAVGDAAWNPFYRPETGG
jgi:hypothetical protein